MSDTSKGPDWWQAAEDGKWYPPELRGVDVPIPQLLDGTVGLQVAGTASYQATLLAVAGVKQDQGVSIDGMVILVPQPTNPYDPNAVAVVVDDGGLIGYLPRDVAGRCARWMAQTGPCIVRARIVGGWDDTEGDEGHFGVRVWLPAESGAAEDEGELNWLPPDP